MDMYLREQSGLKIIADDSVIVCDKIISVTNNVSTNVTKHVSKNIKKFYAKQKLLTYQQNKIGE